MTTHVSVYPNPFTSTLSLEIVVEKNESTIVRMLNEKHNIIRMLSWNLKKGTNKTSLNDLDSVPAGDYYVDIVSMDGKKMFNTRLVKM